MLSKTIADYGGIKVDAGPMRNPQSQLAAAQHNRLAEDTAELTRTGWRAIVTFATIAAAAPQTGATSYDTTVFGNGASYQPAVAKTTTGTYTLTYQSSYTDGLSVPETVQWYVAKGSASSSTFGHVQCVVTAANVVTVYVFDGTPTLSDLGGAIPITVWIR